MSHDRPADPLYEFTVSEMRSSPLDPLPRQFTVRLRCRKGPQRSKGLAVIAARRQHPECLSTLYVTNVALVRE